MERGSKIEVAAAIALLALVTTGGARAGPWTKSAGDFYVKEGEGFFIAAFRTGGLNGVDTSRFLDYDWTLNIKRAR